MPKPLLRTPSAQTKSDSVLSVTGDRQQKKEAQQMDKLKLNRLLRKPRSKKYMEAITKLDAGGHVHNQRQLDEIVNAIREEFPEIEVFDVLLGIVSICYLGDPYEVHTLNPVGFIIEHYEKGRAMPGKLETARSLAKCGSYDCVEVYDDCCMAISPNGSVSVIPF